MNDFAMSDLMKHALGYHTLPSQVNRIRQLSNAFPPYNISVDDAEDPQNFEIEVAIAGYSKEEISVKTRVERGVALLIIEGSKTDKEERKYLVQGLATRNFRREFTMADGIKVDSVTVLNGILTIKLSYDHALRGEKVLQIEG